MVPTCDAQKAVLEKTSDERLEDSFIFPVWRVPTHPEDADENKDPGPVVITVRPSNILRSNLNCRGVNTREDVCLDLWS